MLSKHLIDIKTLYSMRFEITDNRSKKEKLPILIGSFSSYLVPFELYDIL